MKLPDITPAQIAGLLTFVVGQAVAFGLLNTHTSQLVVSIGSIVIGAGFKIADAIIRNGRSKIAVAQIAQGSSGQGYSSPPIKPSA